MRDSMFLREEIQKEQERLKEKSGVGLIASENGPIGLQVILAIAKAFESLEDRIEKIEQRFEDEARAARDPANRL